MLIIGAKGFAKEVLEILIKNDYYINHIYFYDDINKYKIPKLFNKFPILNNPDQVKEHFDYISDEFIIGVGGPHNRRLLYNKFKELGGKPINLISKKSEIGSFDVQFKDGIIITPGVIITNSITIGKGSLINLNTTIGHDCKIGEFVEICPNVNISGNCEIKNNVFIGTSATILPHVKIGENSIIAAGSVVTQDVPSNVMVAGVPAAIKKNLI